MAPLSTGHCEPTDRRDAPPDDRLREAIQSFSGQAIWIASSQELIAMTKENLTDVVSTHSHTN
jgi:hypothetical protein